MNQQAESRPKMSMAEPTFGRLFPAQKIIHTKLTKATTAPNGTDARKTTIR